MRAIPFWKRCGDKGGGVSEGGNEEADKGRGEGAQRVECRDMLAVTVAVKLELGTDLQVHAQIKFCTFC